MNISTEKKEAVAVGLLACYLIDDEACKAEVGEFSLSVIVEQDVLTLEVSVCDVVTVQILNSKYDAVEDGASLVLWKRATTEDVFQQISTLCLLHYDARVCADTHDLQRSHHYSY